MISLTYWNYKGVFEVLDLLIKKINKKTLIFIHFLV